MTRGLILFALLLAPALPAVGAQSPPSGAVVADTPAGAPSDAALLIREGSVARRQVVALGRDVEVAGEALSDVAAIDGAVLVTGTVSGDVVALGGDVTLGPRARVGGDVFALGGTIEAAAGSTVDGRTVSHPTALGTWLTLLEGPSIGAAEASAVILGAKLALMAAWMALTLLLFAAYGREVLATSETLRREPLRCFAVGLTTVLALVLSIVALAAIAPSIAGAPLLVLAVLFALLLKLWGMVAVFHALGGWLLRVARRPGALALNTATAGLLVLGAVKFVPALGAWLWTAATLLGVGAAISSKLGRDEAWFQVGELERRSGSVLG